MKWALPKLSEILTDADSGTWGDPPKGDDSDRPVLRSTNIHKAQIVLTDLAMRSVSERVACKYRLEEGDIIVTTSSGSKQLIGKNALFRQPPDGRTYLYSNFTIRLRPNKDVLVPEFLKYYLNSSRARSELGRIQSTTSGLRNLNVHLYLKQTVPLPPPSEQRRIVEILDQADALRKKRAEADKIADRILPALFYKMFGDPATFVNQHRLGDMIIGIKTKDPRKEPQLRFEYVDIAGVNGDQGAIIETESLLGAEAPSRARKVIRTNDVIVSTVRPYLQATALVPPHLDKQICSTGFCVLRSAKEFGYGFIYAFSRLKWFADALMCVAKGASYPAVSDADIMRLPVPELDEDRFKRFDRIVDNFLAQRNRRQTVYENIAKLLETVLPRAFSGELTAKWREAHMKEMLQEIEQQAKELNLKEVV